MSVDFAVRSPERATVKVRPISILHVGGVGTNALINSSLLTERGYVSHVASNDLYHCIGSPEWQELGSKGLSREELGNDFFPNFFRISESAEVRKRWFVQGPQLLTICYLYYLKSGDTARADTLWQTLQYQRFKAVLNRTTVPCSVRLNDNQFAAAIKSLARPSQRACLSRALFRQRIAGNQSLHEAASAG